MIELTKSPEDTYELKHPSGATFIMRHWTLQMQDEVDTQCIISDQANIGKFKYLVPLEREIKIRLAVADWKGIGIDNQELPCTPENKKRLPVGVVLWLIREIDTEAGLRITLDEKKN